MCETALDSRAWNSVSKNMDTPLQFSLPSFLSPPRILIVEARYYPDISTALLEGAKATLAKVSAKVDVLTLSGALEIPGAIAIAAKAETYDGYVALGCVIRGETSHYDIVATQSAAGIMALTMQLHAIGNGILTVETVQQARERALPSQQDKGGFAACACLELIFWKQKQ